MINSRCCRAIPRILNKMLEQKYTYNNFNNHIRKLNTTQVKNCNYKENNKTQALVSKGYFENVSDKNKNSYLEMVDIFLSRDVYRRGHVEFIYSALKYMKEFGVHKDIEVYKSVLNILPKGKFIPTNVFQAEFMHYPKQQQCAIDLLQQMEDNGVIPDVEMEDMLMNIFGRRGYPLRKYWRMMYWMPKFKNLSPYPLPSVIPSDSLSLARLAIARIMSVDLLSKVSEFKTKDIEDSIDDTWIVSGQSPAQIELLKEHDKSKPIYVQGYYRIWLKEACVNYYVLKSDPIPPIKIENPDTDDVSNIKVPLFGALPPKNKIIKYPSVHEQLDGIIFAVCATGTSSRDSLLSWIRNLERNGNPDLGTIPVVFKIKSPPLSTEEEETVVSIGQEPERIENANETKRIDSVK